MGQSANTLPVNWFVRFTTTQHQTQITPFWSKLSADSMIYYTVKTLMHVCSTAGDAEVSGGKIRSYASQTRPERQIMETLVGGVGDRERQRVRDRVRQ